MNSVAVLAFEDDGTLSVYATFEQAQIAYEGVDVESGVVKFYRRDGTFLEPVFTSPNRRGKFLGLFPWVTSGFYKLVPNPTTAEDPFALALFETSRLNANPWFSSVEALKLALAQEGVDVEWSASRAGEV